MNTVLQVIVTLLALAVVAWMATYAGICFERIVDWAKALIAIATRAHARAPKPKLEEGELWPGEHALDRRLDAMLAEHVGPPPDRQIVTWTAEEREELGHNELLRFIAETDKVLGRLEWEKLRAEMKGDGWERPNLWPKDMLSPIKRESSPIERQRAELIRKALCGSVFVGEKEVGHIHARRYHI